MSDPVPLLAELIGFDTRNPEGDERPLAARLRDELARRGADEVQLVEVPRADEPARPRAYVYARWGAPRLLLNVHLDTVPANAGWTASPHVARIGGGRMTGLGASDTKGAIAAILCALDEAPRPRDLAIVFSGDEELNGTCMRAFLATPAAQGIERAIVCEPTSCRAGVRHRGIIALEIELAGAGGHSSAADRMPAPLAELARVAVAIDDWGKAWRGRGPKGFEGMCVNVARFGGGVAFNVVPEQANLLVSLRPPPGVDAAAVQDELRALIGKVLPAAKVSAPLANPTFATRELTAYAPLLGDIAAAPVDLPYWTEAAVLASAGIDAVVFGPGDIAQAHAPDEWVAIADLQRARDVFVQVLHGCR